MMDGHAAHPARPMFDAYLQRWNLAPAGAPITTPAARLLPVLHEGQPAMLKISHEQDEREGGVLMRWWDGQGAARVLAHDDDAILLERATGTRSLAEYARNGRDDEATRIICDVLARLHAPRAKAAAAAHAGILVRRPVAHGAGARRHPGRLRPPRARPARRSARPGRAAWRRAPRQHPGLRRARLAGDRPKRLHGERAFDYANIFCNPDLADPRPPVAIVPGCFDRRFALITTASGLEPRRLLQWIAAWCGLSAAWFMGDGDDAAIDLNIAGQALARLAR